MSERPSTTDVLEQQASMAYAYRNAVNGLAMALGGIVVVTLAVLLGGLVRFFWKGDPMIESWLIYLVAAWVLGSFMMKLLPGWGLGPVEELRRTTLLLVSVFAGTTAMLFWGKAAHETSRFTLTFGLLVCVVLVPLIRLQIKRMLIDRSMWGASTVILTNGIMGPQIIKAIQQEPGLGYLPVGVLTNEEALPVGSRLAGLPVIGRLGQRQEIGHVAIIALPDLTSHETAELIEQSLSQYRRVLIIPDMAEIPSLWVKPRDLVGMLGLEIPNNLLDPMARFVKRGFDLTFTLFTLPLWIPTLLLTALAVWLQDMASPFFAQERIGMKGHSFKTWKFRTMHPNAEELLRQKLEEDEVLKAEWETSFKLRRDPRITRIGSFLRKTSLDELPQLINILWGNMSLIGPRPLPAYHHQELPERTRDLRQRVRPGLTGLWQVSGRSEAGHAGMTKWDTYYVRNWSIWLDIVIFVRTIREVFSGRGAY